MDTNSWPLFLRHDPFQMGGVRRPGSASVASRGRVVCIIGPQHALWRGRTCRRHRRLRFAGRLAATGGRLVPIVSKSTLPKRRGDGELNNW